MMKIAARTFDIYDDDTGEIARAFPTELHTLKLAGREEVDGLPDRAFALVMKTADGQLRRRYPLHTPDSVKLSRAYFDTIKADLHPALVKVAEAKFANPESPSVAYVDITALETPPPQVKFAEQHWGLTIEGRSCFPLHDDTLVKLAVARFPFTIGDLSPEERFLYARNIEKRAASVSVSIPHESQINLYTSDTVNKIALKIAIDQRKKAAGHYSPASTMVLDQLGQAAGCLDEQGGAETIDSFQHRAKIASSMKTVSADRIIGVLQQFDKLAGFGSHHYLRGMLDPFAACFKKADCGATMMVDGVDLSKVDPQQLRQQFDEHMAGAFMENPVQVYQSLPEPIKQIVRDMAQYPTQSPQKAEVPSGSGEPMQQLAPTLANGMV